VERQVRRRCAGCGWPRASSDDRGGKEGGPGPGEPKAPARPSLAVAAMPVRGRNGGGASAGAVRQRASRRRAAATCVARAKDARGIGLHGWR
jgi:hypothetical protein